MNTLSDDITLSLSTTNISTGYVNEYIYCESIGIFTGRTWVDSNHSNVLVNLNELIMQNRNKYDYLKLTDTGNVQGNTMRRPVQQDPTIFSYFVNGQISNYSVSLVDSNNNFTVKDINVLTAYDYPNKDLEINVNYPENGDTSTSRMMQGCNWTVSYERSIGIFTNKLLPHYPAILTSKYGFGLQIHDKTNNAFSLTTRNTLADGGYKLGKPYVDRTAAMFFDSLANVLIPLTLDEGDTKVYLKLTGSYNDEYGNYDMAVKYYGAMTILSINVKTYDEVDHTLIDTNTYTRSNASKFFEYLDSYLTVAYDLLDRTSPYYRNLSSWDTVAITASASTVIYRTPNFDDGLDVENDLARYSTFLHMVTVENDPNYTGAYSEVLINVDVPSGVLHTSVPTTYNGKCPVAILDRCYIRYYLAWNDRYGDIQSLPFDGKIIYSETTETSEIKDYKLRRKVSQKLILPKWKLNTKWMTEDVYPIYESIFTSPYLLLYDTATDRSWNVILTDTEYTEKTYKNDKMINLEINVEANATQNYIY